METQLQQLKLNVTNIRSVLKSANKRNLDLRKSNSTLISQRNKQNKLREKEAKVEKKITPKSSPISSIKEIASPSMGLFDKITNLGSILLAGVLFGALPGIVKKIEEFKEENKEVIDNVVGALTKVKDFGEWAFNAMTGPEAKEGAFDDIAKFDDQGNITGGALKKVEDGFNQFGRLLNKIDRAVGGKGTVGNAFIKDPYEQESSEPSTNYGSSRADAVKRAREGYRQSGTLPPSSSGGSGDGREDAPVPLSGGILEGARKIIGSGRGKADQCAITTREALKKAGHPMANVRTQIGDLDTPRGIAYNGAAFAASFGGSDMGQVIRTKSNIKAGDIILWRADRDLGGMLNKGAITHVGIAADDGLKHQFDHNRASGFHYRRHWHSSGGTSWFAGIRLGASRGASKMDQAKLSSNTEGSGDARASLSNPENASKDKQIAMLNNTMGEEGSTTYVLMTQQVLT